MKQFSRDTFILIFFGIFIYYHSSQCITIMGGLGGPDGDGELPEENLVLASSSDSSRVTPAPLQA